MRRLLQFLVAAVSLSYSLSSASAVPLEPTVFTSVVMQSLSQKVGASGQVSMIEPLGIRLELSGRVINARLESLYRHCVSEGGFCRDSIKRYVDSCVELAAGPPEKPRAAELRVLVRDSAYVKQLNAIHADKGSPPPVARQHYLPDLWIVLAIAGESVQWITSLGVIESLGLNESSAFDLALKNTRAAILPLSHVAKPAGQTPFSFSVGDYDSSRLLMYADWAAIAERQKGELHVSIPATDMIIFGTVESGTDLQQLRETATKANRAATDPLNPNIYRWRGGAWELVSDEHVVAAPEKARPGQTP